MFNFGKRQGRLKKVSEFLINKFEIVNSSAFVWFAFNFEVQVLWLENTIGTLEDPWSFKVALTRLDEVLYISAKFVCNWFSLFGSNGSPSLNTIDEYEHEYEYADAYA